MNKSKLVIMFILFIIIFNLTGCWDAMPLERVFAVTGIGVDVSKENPELLTITIFGPSIIQEAEEDYITFSAEGKNIMDGLKHLRNKTYRHITVAHVKVILFSEEVARNGIRKYFDHFIRDAEIGGDVVIGITSERADEFLRSKVPSNPNTGMFIHDLILTRERDVDPKEYLMRGIVNNINEPERMIMPPYVELGKDKKQMVINRSTIFKEGRLIAVLDEEETLSLLLLRNSIRRDTINLGRITPNKRQGEEQSYSIRIFPRERKVDIKVTENDVNIEIKYKIYADLLELVPPYLDLDQKQLDKLQEEGAKELEKRMLNMIQKLQKEYKVDAINLSDYFRIYHPEHYKKLNWQDVFVTAKFDVKVELYIEEFGLTK